MREISETEIPKWQGKRKGPMNVKQLGHFVENYEATLKQSQYENEEVQRKYSEIQQTCVKAQAELVEVKEINSKLQSQRDELIERLAGQESATQAAQKRSKNFPVGLDTLKRLKFH